MHSHERAPAAHAPRAPRLDRLPLERELAHVAQAHVVLVCAPALAGVERLVLLGGAQLIADLFQTDAVDELQLTLVPQLLGGDHCWLPLGGEALPEGLAFEGARQLP